MNVSDLKNNMICKTRSGEYKFVVDIGEDEFGWVGICNNTSWCHLGILLNDDLTCHRFSGDKDDSLDIIEVYKPNSIYAVGRIIDSIRENIYYFEEILDSYYTKIYDRKSEKATNFIALLEDKNADLETIVELFSEWEKLTSTEKAECIDAAKGSAR